jgi:endonuclease/exonuclease/phosphatase (EEP) superfamily protein YafD
MADEKQPAKKRRPANDPAGGPSRPREKHPVIPLPQRRRGWRPEIEERPGGRGGWAKRLLVGAAWLAVLVMAAGAALRLFLHDRWMPLVWWNSFTLYVYLPVYACLLIALFMRRWRLAGLASAVAACHLVWITPDFLPPARRLNVRGEEDRASAGGGFRLYYQNLNKHAEDFQSRIDAILEEDPDVIALVELDPPWEEAVKQSDIFTKYPHHTLRPNPLRSQQLAIFSKLPLDDVEYRYILGRRLAVAATVRVADAAVRVYCIHAPRPLEEQEEQFRGYCRDVVDWIGQSRIARVLVGDFNATQHSAWHQQLCSQGRLHSAHREAGRGYAVTWPNGRFPLPPIRIDHILLSPELVCRRIREGDGGQSDHKPLIAELALASGGG